MEVLRSQLAIGLAGATLASGAFAAETALGDSNQSVQNPADLPATVVASFHTEGSYAHEKVSDVATGKVTILANIKANGMPAKQHRKLEAEGLCKTVDGTEQVLYSKGYNVEGGQQFGRDYRRSRVCKVAGRWIRVKCGNEELIKETPKQPAPGRVVWVKTFANQKVSVSANADAYASCETSHTKATGKGHGTAKATVSLREFVKTSKNTHAGDTSVAIRVAGSAYGKASASAEATAVCMEETDTIVITQTPPTPPPVTGTKNGTETPPPPANAPGPNPAPSPQDPAPGAHACFSEATGAPVTPRPDNTCPAGSYGTVN